MVEANENLEWETTDPGKLSYYIREAISVSCLLYKDDHENEKAKGFSNLKSKFIIKIKGNRVIAVLRNEIPPAIMSVRKLKSVYLPSIGTLTEIVGAIAKYIIEEEKEQITIPSFNLSGTELTKLRAYLKSKELEIEVNENELVISKNSN